MPPLAGPVSLPGYRLSPGLLLPGVGHVAAPLLVVTTLEQLLGEGTADLLLVLIKDLDLPRLHASPPWVRRARRSTWRSSSPIWTSMVSSVTWFASSWLRAME